MLKYETGNDKQTSLANTRIRSSHLKKLYLKIFSKLHVILPIRGLLSSKICLEMCRHIELVDLVSRVRVISGVGSRSS